MVNNIKSCMASSVSHNSEIAGYIRYFRLQISNTNLTLVDKSEYFAYNVVEIEGDIMVTIIRKCYLETEGPVSIHDFQPSQFPDLIRMSTCVTDEIQNTTVKRCLKDRRKSKWYMGNEIYDELISLLEQHHLADIKYEVHKL